MQCEFRDRLTANHQTRINRFARCHLPKAFVLLLFTAQFTIPCSAAEPTSAATAAFNSYIAASESRLAQQHRAPTTFFGPLSGQDRARLRSGGFVIEKITPSVSLNLPGAMLHDWRGTAFVPGATVADFERLMRNFNAYPQRYAPQVLRAHIVAQHDDHYQVVMRVRQKHVVTVVLDSTYDVTFGRLDAQHGYSLSRGTNISEIDSAGTPKEHALKPDEEHGFLWRLNTYWSYEQRDRGLYMQIESISLTRAIPTGLGWAIGPFVESVPRESLEFTLRQTCNALHK